MNIDVSTVFVLEILVSLLLSRTLMAHLRALVRRARNALGNCGHVAVES